MAALTKIEWADSTANLWIGCTAISPGCDNCYAEADWDKRKHRVTWGPHGDRSFCAAGWDLILRMQRAAARNNGVDPALGRKRRIFVNSLADFFDNHRSIVWREEAFKLFEACPDVILMLVTKRPENIVRMVPDHWLMPGGWPAHVWLIVTTEDQERYDHRWPILRDLPGPAVKALSAEPLLGPIQLRDLLHLDWLIVGGESGPDARPMSPAWAQSLRDQCAAGGVPFLFKQWGEWVSALQIEGVTAISTEVGKTAHLPIPRMRKLFGGALDGRSFPSHPQNTMTLRTGKATAGRHLDGRTWDQFPEMTLRAG